MYPLPPQRSLYLLDWAEQWKNRPSLATLWNEYMKQIKQCPLPPHPVLSFSIPFSRVLLEKGRPASPMWSKCSTRQQNDPPPDLRASHTLYKWFLGQGKEGFGRGRNHSPSQTLHFSSAESHSHIGMGLGIPVLQEWFLRTISTGRFLVPVASRLFIAIQI